MNMPESDGPRPGDQLGEFQILGLIGEGAMGKVYEARQISLQRRVALKVLPPTDGRAGDQTALTRFYREARAAAQLNHPNIVPVYGFGVEQGHYYYAMQFVQGKSLHEVIHAPQDPLRDQRRIATYILNVARGLHTAHSQGVIHRDIKPANIMIRSDDEAVITDFGLSRHEKRKSITQVGALMGTPVYMAPEQARGERIDHTVDIYALGVTLYEALTGQVPFLEKNLRALLVAITSVAPKPLQEVRPDVSPDLEAIALKALEKEPKDRYATAKDMADDLLRFLRGEVVQARPTSGMQVALRKLEKQPLVVGLLLALVVLLVLWPLSTAWLLRRQPAQEARAALEASDALLKDPLAQHQKAREALQQARRERDAKLHRRRAKAGRQAALERALLELRSVEARLLAPPEDKPGEGSLAEKGLRHLRRALALAPVDHSLAASARERAGELLQALVLACEGQGQKELAATYRRELQGLGLSEAKATLIVETDPPGAALKLHVVKVDAQGAWSLDAGRDLGVSPQKLEELPAGEHLLLLSAPGRVDVRLPFLAAPGEEVALRLELPASAGLPAGFVYVAPGELLAGGDPDAVRPLWRRPEPTWVDGFFIGRHEVSVREYLEFLKGLSPLALGNHLPASTQFLRAGEGLAADPAQLEHPVVGVRYASVLEYCAWRSAKDGVGYRVPGDAEWEKVARGPAGRPFPWGTSFTPGEQPLANLHRLGSPAIPTSPVGSFPRDCSIYGAFDLGGNLSEWVEGVFGGNSTYAALRGGSWERGPEVTRASSREALHPRAFETVAPRIGFRVAFD